ARERRAGVQPGRRCARLAARAGEAADRGGGARLVRTGAVPAGAQADRHRRLLRRRQQDQGGAGLALADPAARGPGKDHPLLSREQGTLPVSVPFGDFKAHVAALRGEIDAAVARVLDSGWFILGPEGEAFERELAAALGARDAVAVANGTEA